MSEASDRVKENNDIMHRHYEGVRKASSPEGAPSALERFIDNCVGMADAVMGLGELDEPEMFQNDLRAARAELSALRRDNAEMRKALEDLRRWVAETGSGDYDADVEFDKQISAAIFRALDAGAKGER